MKQIGIIALAITLILTSQLVAAASITDTYTAGNPVTVTTMDNIKAAVNDNDTRVGDNTTAIGNNAASIGGNTTAIGGNTTATGVNSGLIGTNITDISTNSGLIGTNSTDISTNTINIGINSASITAHDARITDLEGASPATGRIALTVSDGTPTKALANSVSSSAISTAFPIPSDYVAGTVTIKALVSGCGGFNARVSISRNGVSVGSNPLIFIVPTAQTISIPAAPIFSFFVVEVTTTTTSLSDLNFVTLTRIGADANDTCTGSLVVRGYIVEYPRG